MFLISRIIYNRYTGSYTNINNYSVGYGQKS
jgi:hypothetical protein